MTNHTYTEGMAVEYNSRHHAWVPGTVVRLHRGGTMMEVNITFPNGKVGNTLVPVTDPNFVPATYWDEKLAERVLVPGSEIVG